MTGYIQQGTSIIPIGPSSSSELERGPGVQKLQDILSREPSTCTAYAVSPESLFCVRPGNENSRLMFGDMVFIYRREVRDGTYVVTVKTEDDKVFTYPLSSETSSKVFMQTLLDLWILN